MISRTIFRPKKDSTRDDPTRYTCEDLIRLLVSQAITSGNAHSPLAQQAGFQSNEEVLLDIDLDGTHYLLVRLPKEHRSQAQLSPREQEIVRMVAKGYANKMIADVLSISSWTVCTHLRRIFAKLGVGSRAAMVARTLEEGKLWDRPSGTNRAFVKSASSAESSDATSMERAVVAGGRALQRRAG